MGPFCLICKAKLFNNICSECEKRNPLFENMICIGSYSGILKSLIYNFKYEKKKDFGPILANLLAKQVKLEIKPKLINIVTSIPLHDDKIKTRGFNQSEIIAKVIAKEILKPNKNIITRCKNTIPQFKLDNQARNKNISGAFLINSKVNLSNKNILLVDDIFTTGSTIQEACKVLKKKGVNKIYVCCIARG